MVGGVKMVAKSLMFLTLALLTVAPVAGATGALDSVFTITLDKRAYQMGEEITINFLVQNQTQDTLIIGNDFLMSPNWKLNKGIGDIIPLTYKLIKKKAYSTPFLKKGEPKRLDQVNRGVEELASMIKGTKVPPGFKKNMVFDLVSKYPAGSYGHGLNPGSYALRVFMGGGPPPLGGWWSNEVEFEVLKPEGVDSEAWNLFSREFKRIEKKTDSLERLDVELRHRKEAYEGEREEVSFGLLDMEEKPYRQVVLKYPNTPCSQRATRHLKWIYGQKINNYLGSLRYDKAEEVLRSIVPDSLRPYFRAYIDQDKEDYIKKWGKEDFEKSVKQAIERDSIREEQRKQQQGKGVK
jgi:hypothetical protein